MSVPEDAVGDVIGDLNGRRGRPLGMEPKGTMTDIKAEVPMAEMLNYAPDLRSITGGRGEYAMEFARYEEIPAHLTQKVISAAHTEEEAAATLGVSRATAFRDWAYARAVLTAALADEKKSDSP